jgi:hypothetical protein
MKTLVPVWIIDSDNPALARMTRRPVLIAIDELELTMRGQVVGMTMAHALLRPDGQFYLCKSVYVEISFRFEATRYTLAGTAQPSEADQGFRIDFDTVARKTIAGMGERLKMAGLLDPIGSDPKLQSAAVDVAPGDAEAVTKKPEPVDKSSGRMVRHDGPPHGVERRAHPRYDVDVYVRLLLVEEARRLECTMIDLSMGGCRLYFEQPHGLAKGQHVETQFIGDGLPLRLAAVVQVCEKPKVVGLRFVSVGARMQERLEWLISEVAAGRAIAAQNQ